MKSRVHELLAALVSRGAHAPSRAVLRAPAQNRGADEVSQPFDLSMTSAPRILGGGVENNTRGRVCSPLIACVVAALAVWLAQAGSALAANSVTTSFEAANRLYEQNQFAQAAAAYEQLLQTGYASPALYFNLGNAYFKSGQIGKAVAIYRQAEQLTPRDPDVRANLQFARNLVQGPSLRAAAWQRWFGRLTVNELSVLAMVPFWLWLSALAAGRFVPTWRTALHNWVLSLGTLTAVLCLCVATAFYARQEQPAAIVAGAEVIVHNGPLDESPTSFTVHDGAELRVLDRKDDWLEVTAGNQRIGWLKHDQVVMPAS